MSYYGADNKLRVFDRVIGFDPLSDDRVYGMRGTFDEYRYDALGRRVLARTRRIGGTCPGTLDCQSRAVRTVWDGDRILYEIRAVGGDIVTGGPPPPDSTPDTLTVSRRLRPASLPIHGPEAGETEFALPNHIPAPPARADTIPDPGIESDGTYVSYTHALGVSGIDEPIGIHKFGYQSIFPHTGWRGMLAMGTYANGAESDCAVAVPCDRIDWPAAKFTIDQGGYARSEAETWFGSLASTGTEGSGLQYMRNRYYDPKRGQFTQEDPIGLAGGMNLYGFAGGDPVNFNDPFGLCPPKDSNTSDCANDDLGNAWRKLDESKAGRKVIGQYVESSLTVDTDVSDCAAANCTIKAGGATAVHTSGNAAAMAVGLSHEIVHVRGSARPGTKQHEREERSAWGNAFGVYRSFGSADRSASGYTGRYNLWTSNRSEFNRQIACAVYNNCR